MFDTTICDCFFCFQWHNLRCFNLSGTEVFTAASGCDSVVLILRDGIAINYWSVRYDEFVAVLLLFQWHNL
ncbi:MAG: hypothetical protein R2772_10340 [Chitinophagales bacterium]